MISIRFAVPVFSVVLLLASGLGHAQDKIVTKSGQTHTGKILEVSNGTAQINIGAGTIGLKLTDIASVEMTPPTEMKLAQGASPDRALGLLQPVLKKFKGLPVNWIVDAMGQMGDAYSAQGKNAEAQAIYQEIGALYPGSRYVIKANVGLAKTAFQNKKHDDALKLIQPLISEANKKVFPQPEEARLYAEAFFLQGQVQEAQGQLSLALESYLTVVTIFHHNTEVAKLAQQKADQLRQKNRDLTVS